MPLPPPIDNATKVELIYDNAGLEAVNVLWFSAEAPATQANLNDLCSDVATAWLAEIMPLLYQTAVLTEVRGSWYTGGVAQIEAQHLVTGGEGGVVDADPAPPQVAVVLSWRTLIGGRQNRGRTYLPGIPNNVVGDDGRLTEAARIAFQTAGNDFIAVLEADADYEFVVYSRPTYDPPRPGTNDPDPPRPGHMTGISACQVNARVDTQRGRLDN